MNAVHKQLGSDQEDKLRHERAVEVLSEKIKSEYAYDASRFEKQITSLDFDEADQKPSSAMAKAREHIETLERIQQTESEEHDEMLFTIRKWRAALRKEPNEEQEQHLRRQEKLLNRLFKEWDDREKELRQLRMRLDGNLASI